MNKNGLVFDVESKPKFSQLIVFAFQQLLAIMAATIAVPSVIKMPIAVPAALLGAGVGTLVYILFTKGKSPVFLGSSFAFLSALGTGLAYGYCGIILGSVLAGLVYVLFAVIIHFCGTNWVQKLLPPVVIGPVVACIGLSLAGNAAGDMVKANASLLNGGYNLVALLCALITLFTVIICSTQEKFKSMKLIPFIIGIGAGYISALLFTVIGHLAGADYLMILDWSPIVDNFKDFSFTSIFNYPDFALIGGIEEIITGAVSTEVAAGSMAYTETVAQTLNWAGVAEVAVAFIPVALVVFAEHIADHKNLGSIIGRDLVGKEPGLKRTLLGDGVGSIAGTFMGICPNTTYGESVACVAITKNASVRSIFVAAIMCIAVSFFRPLMVVLMTIPSCVMGGVCLTLYGFIAVSGLKMFKDIDLSQNKNLFVVSAILIAGIGGLTVQIPYAIAESGAVANTIKITSIATALILGVVINFVLTKIEEKNAKTKESAEQEKEVASTEE